MGGRSHTHKSRIQRRKKAIQALGRDVRLLVSITEPLHGRDAGKEGKQSVGVQSLPLPTLLPLQDSAITHKDLVSTALRKSWSSLATSHAQIHEAVQRGSIHFLLQPMQGPPCVKIISAHPPPSLAQP